MPTTAADAVNDDVGVGGGHDDGDDDEIMKVIKWKHDELKTTEIGRTVYLDPFESICYLIYGSTKCYPVHKICTGTNEKEL